MRVLIDITHPAYLHFFRHAIKRLQSEGHELCLTGRDKDILRPLAEEYEIGANREVVSSALRIIYFGRTPQNLLDMFSQWFMREIWLAGVIKKFKPDVIAACAGTFTALLGKLIRIPTIVFYDTENDVVSNWMTYPFATRICVPECYLDKNIPRNVRYAGYHSLAYLHPDQFTPDPKVLNELGLKPDESYAVVRFVGWKAGHDLGKKGLTTAQKISAVQELAEYGRVFISSEGELPEELVRFRFPLRYSRMHDAIAFASLVFGESSTMCSEAAVLGVPSVFIYPRVKRGYTQEQSEKWKIVFWYSPNEFGQALEKAAELMRADDAACRKAIGKQIVESSVNVADFICGQILDFAPHNKSARSY